MIILTDFQSKISQDNSTYSKLLFVISFHSGKNLEATYSIFVNCVEKALAWSNEKEKNYTECLNMTVLKLIMKGEVGNLNDMATVVPLLKSWCRKMIQTFKKTLYDLVIRLQVNQVSMRLTKVFFSKLYMLQTQYLTNYPFINVCL